MMNQIPHITVSSFKQIPCPLFVAKQFLSAVNLEEIDVFGIRCKYFFR